MFILHVLKGWKSNSYISKTFLQLEFGMRNCQKRMCMKCCRQNWGGSRYSSVCAMRCCGSSNGRNSSSSPESAWRDLVPKNRLLRHSDHSSPALPMMGRSTWFLCQMTFCWNVCVVPVSLLEPLFCVRTVDSSSDGVMWRSSESSPCPLSWHGTWNNTLLESQDFWVCLEKSQSHETFSAITLTSVRKPFCKNFFKKRMKL